MKSNEEKLQAITRQLTVSGWSDVLAYAKTVLKAEAGIKKQYGLDGEKSSVAESEKKSA